MSQRSWRLLIADDHALVREGMRTMLGRESDLEIVGEAKDGRQAVELARRLRPDLVLMDVRMPEMDGLSATREIKRHIPEIAVLIITTYENPDYLFEAVRAGAAGYVLKDATRQQLTEAIRKALSGEPPLDDKLTMDLLRRLAREGGALKPERNPESTPEHGLTPREVEVLQLLSEGQTNREIAESLVVSPSTVKVHIQHIIGKLGVSDRTQAAVRAAELGLLSRRG